MAKEEDIRRQKTQDGANAATMRIATFTIFTFAILLVGALTSNAQIFAFGVIIGIFTIYLQFKKAAKVGA
jgi:hypothetical protein